MLQYPVATSSSDDANRCLPTASTTAPASAQQYPRPLAATRSDRAQDALRIGTARRHRTTGALPDRHDDRETRIHGHGTDLRPAPFAPAPPNHPCPFACRSPQRQAKPSSPAQARSSSAQQGVEHDAQLFQIDRAQDQPRRTDLQFQRTAHTLWLDPGDLRSGDSGRPCLRQRNLRSYHHRDKLRRESTLLELAHPFANQVRVEPVGECHCRQGCTRYQALLYHRSLVCSTEIPPAVARHTQRLRQTHPSIRHLGVHQHS